MNIRSRSRWKAWLAVGRIVPLITILFAVAVSLAQLVGVPLTQGQFESIVIVLLGLLAINSLTERLTMLERIEARLPNHSEHTRLSERRELKPLEESAPHVQELWIVSVSASALFPSQYQYFEGVAQRGASIRVLLVDPDGEGLEAWEKWVTVSDTIDEIKTSIKYLDRLDGVEVKLSPTVLPFSMMIFDPENQDGWAVVEYHGYRVTTHRPHVLLRNDGGDGWFANYRKQFLELWDVAKPHIKDTPAQQGH